MNRPYVIINCAMSLDAKIASPSGKQIRISCDKDIKRMYELRNSSDAVVVGINTVLSDDPKLTVKEKYVKNPKNPIRIILDTKCKTPTDALVVNNSAKTIIAVSKECNKKYKNNVEILNCKTKNNIIDLEDFLDKIYKKGIKKLMVEGGSQIITNFIKEGLVDDLFIYIGSVLIGGKNTPSLISKINKNIKLNLVKIEKIGSGILVHYKL